MCGNIWFIICLVNSEIKLLTNDYLYNLTINSNLTEEGFK